MKILVSGSSGYVGSRLIPRLLSEGHTVRGLSRRPARAHPGNATTTDAAVTVVTGDAVSGDGLQAAFDGIEVAYFLIHAMEPSPNGEFQTREQRAAENFARAAQAAGVRRIVYLGGILPAAGPASAHLASRLQVEEILLGASACSVALRASIIIGAQSRPFRFLVRLVERLPVLAVPAWHTRRTTPIDERDVVELLARAATNEEVCGQSLDIGGSETVSYGELIDMIRDHLLLARPTISFKRLMLTPIASRISALIADEQYELIGPLMGSLGEDLLMRDNRTAEILGVRLHSLDSAIEHALAEWESTEPLAAR